MFREQNLVNGILGKFDGEVGVITPQESDSSERLLFIADWNKKELKHLSDALEHDFYENREIGIHWDDEWSTCSDCGAGIKMTPDCYGWQPNYIRLEYDTLCRKCSIENIVEVLEEEFYNNPRKAAPSWLRNEALRRGMISLVQDDFESGMHPGQTDDPQKILKEYIEENPEDGFIFCFDSVGQFDIHFSIYKIVEEVV